MESESLNGAVKRMCLNDDLRDDKHTNDLAVHKVYHGS